MIGLYENEEQAIETPDVLLYRHCDGYPGHPIDKDEYGILTDIVPFLRAFNSRRGLDDTMYLGAWLMWWLINGHVERLEEKDCLGHGICKPGRFHGDIEWYYRINGVECTIEVFRTPFDSTPKSWSRVETFNVADPVFDNFRTETAEEINK